MDVQTINSILTAVQCNGGVDHVLDLCDGLSVSQLDVLQLQIRDRRNARAGFLRLPGEIRNKIYELVIETEIMQPSGSCMDLASLKKLLVGVSGFNICTQIRSEFRSFLEPDSIKICTYDGSNSSFIPVDVNSFGKHINNAHWFRALGCESLESAQKYVKMCEDDMDADYCGTILFGPALGLRPMFFAADFLKPTEKLRLSRKRS